MERCETRALLESRPVWCEGPRQVSVIKTRKFATIPSKMDIKDRLNADLKKAMLSGDKRRAMTLRGLKSAILYAEVARGERDEGLSNEEALKVLAKEAKKRQESIELYEKGGSADQAQEEAAEKSVIEEYLPEQLSEDSIRTIVDEEIASLEDPSMKDMGTVIKKVQARGGSGVGGSTVARLVKERLQQ